MLAWDYLPLARLLQIRGFLMYMIDQLLEGAPPDHQQLVSVPGAGWVQTAREGAGKRAGMGTRWAHVVLPSGGRSRGGGSARAPSGSGKGDQRGTDGCAASAAIH